MAAEFDEDRALLGNFYRGRVVKLRRGSQSGVIESCASGRQFVFEWPLVRLVGAEKLDVLQLGMEVGFDVSRTSRGLRVSTIRVFPPSDWQVCAEETSSSSARERPTLALNGPAVPTPEQRD